MKEIVQNERPVPQFTDQTSRLPRHKIVTIFLACATVDLAALIDQSTLAVALPTIASSLRANSQALWFANSYYLTSTSCQLLYGRLSDIWSRKLVLLVGLAILFLGSLGASLANTAEQLILFRAFTGIGGGGLVTIAMIIVGDVVSLRERGKWQGIMGAAVALAYGIGPVIGGVLTSMSADSWRWIFRFNFFTIALTTTMVIFFMPLKKVEGHWKTKLAAIDFTGAALTLTGSTLLVLGLTWGGAQFSWSALRVILSLALGGFFTIAFVIWQWKGARVPLLPLHIFKSTMISGAMLTMFVNGWNYEVQIYYIPTFYQLAYGYSPVRAACLLIPLTLVQTASSTLSGLIVTWRGRYRESILAGWIIWAIGLGLYSTLNSSSNLGAQIGYAMLTGFGVGHTLQPSLIAIQAGVSRGDMAVVTAGRNFTRNLGATFGLAVAGTIINSTILKSLAATLSLNLSAEEIHRIVNDPTLILERVGDDAVRNTMLEAYFRGFRVVFLLNAGLATVSGLIALFLMPQLDLKKNEDEVSGSVTDEEAA